MIGVRANLIDVFGAIKVVVLNIGFKGNLEDPNPDKVLFYVL